MFNLNDKLSKNTAKQLSPITLAFIGDAVYTLFVREKIVFEKELKGSELNRKTSAVVKATAQAKFIDVIMPFLTEEEIEIYKRARNYKTQNIAKNAKVIDYKKATGFEAVLGYLYLNGETQRLNEILKECKDENRG